MELAELFLKGEGVLKNEEVAFKYAERAAKVHDDENAWFKLGQFYEGGVGVPANRIASYDCYVKAADKGHTYAQYFAGLLSEPDYEKAMHYYEQAMNNGNVDARYHFGLILANVHNRWDEALTHFTIAAKEGHCGALGAIGLQYLKGLGTEKDTNTALEYLRKASNLGDASSQFHLSQLYLRGEIIEKDEALGVTLLKKSADAGHSSALYHLGILYYKGKGVEKNLGEAVACIEKAAKGGNKQAKTFLDKTTKL